MANTTFSSREFNHDLSRAKKAAHNGPVFITDRGKPSHVLMTYQDYNRMSSTQTGIVEALSLKGLSDIAFEPPEITMTIKEADLV